jgi:2-polyprenyl-3-methyl-5-hydroxy-6-metoxy-1,4-benzoquinol methylase
MSTQQEYWSAYYRTVFQQGQRWLDYSNERVQAQTFGLVLEAAGPIQGRRCVDVGCGWGQLARALFDLGAAAVTAIDVVAESMECLANEHPQIRWLTGDLSRDGLGLPHASVDLLLLVEVLQYMPLADTLRTAWQLLAPGGRLVAVVPNAACPIVASTRQRFDSRYAPASFEQLDREMSALEGVEEWAFRGLTFAEDQRIAPYETTPWARAPSWPRQPNRLQLAAIKTTQ